uniref:Metallophos domain-containing protein n=1 Tax=Caenorhabditis japonica TaxID=281687 RepID=A0A8R1HKH8_CAEJA
MYYVPATLQYLLFDVTAICAGIWTNMIAFVCGFGLVNFFAKQMKMYSFTLAILNLIGKIPYFHALLWSRRSQLKFTFVVTLLLSVSMFISRDWIVVKHKTINLRNFTGEGNRLTLAVISDLHAGASVYKEQVDKVVEKVLENPVDGILIVGDMVDAPVAEIEERVKPILQLPQHAPTFFVTGNHEYYYGDAREWIQMYTNGKIKVLKNENTMLKGVCLAGVNDISSTKSGISRHNMDLKSATEGCPKDVSQIVMSHNPASVREFFVDHPKELADVDLIISGHTHAGQFYVVIPVVYWLLPYFYGLYEIPFGGKLMITAGSLYQGPPMKMLGMSEVWILELVGV